MVERSQALESLTVDERIVLMGRLWDSLESAAAAPLSPAPAAELDARETEADADPDSGIPWAALRDERRTRIRSMANVRIRAQARAEIAEKFE